MKTTTMLVVAAFAVSALALPAMAGEPGHRAFSYAFPVASYFDFKDGVGVADPTDENSPCTALLLGLRVVPLIVETWHGDLDVATNLNGFGLGVSNLVPPLPTAGGWLPNSAGIATPVPCPTQIGGSGAPVYAIWSGLNWRSAEWDVWATLTLCNQLTFSSSSPGCVPLPSANLRLWATACVPGSETFLHDYTDFKGKEDFNGNPYDTLGMKQDRIICTPDHSHDFTNTVQDFASNNVAQTFDNIKVESVVHYGSTQPRGWTYMAICWRVDYVNFQNPLDPVFGLQANAHSWKLVLDVDKPETWPAALLQHLGPFKGAAALGGLYSQSETEDGENGFGPCQRGTQPPEPKKPSNADATGQPTLCMATLVAADCDGNAAACTLVGTQWVCTQGTCQKGYNVIVVNAQAYCGATPISKKGDPIRLGSKTAGGAYTCVINFPGGSCLKREIRII